MTRQSLTHDPRPVQAGFLALLPKLERVVRFHLRGEKDGQRRDEAAADILGLCWQWFARLARRGKDASALAPALVGYAARAVRSGRHVGGAESTKDVLSWLARRRHGFAVHAAQSLVGGAFCLHQALADNTVTPPDEQAAFRLDFPAWLQTRSVRDRQLALRLMVGERALDVSRTFGLSAPRVSQLRRELYLDWRRYCGEPVLAPPGPRRPRMTPLPVAAPTPVALAARR